MAAGSSIFQHLQRIMPPQAFQQFMQRLQQTVQPQMSNSPFGGMLPNAINPAVPGTAGRAAGNFGAAGLGAAGMMNPPTPMGGGQQSQFGPEMWQQLTERGAGNSGMVPPGLAMQGGVPGMGNGGEPGFSGAPGRQMAGAAMSAQPEPGYGGRAGDMLSGAINPPMPPQRPAGMGFPANPPMPPPRPAGIGAQPPRPDFQSNGMEVLMQQQGPMPGGGTIPPVINWGDANNAADFFRADKAMMQNPGLRGFNSFSGY
jgi:hypothetical protein